MKITKNGQAVKSCDEIELSSLPQSTDCSVYQCAADYILQVIECLGPLASEGDSKAREAIANLSVVLLDIKPL